MSSDGQRQIIGQRVYAKALHVTALAEFPRQYRSQPKSKEVVGTALECIGKKTKNNRSSIYVKVMYALGGGTLKTVELNIRSVLKLPPPTILKISYKRFSRSQLSH